MDAGLTSLSWGLPQGKPIVIIDQENMDARSFGSLARMGQTAVAEANKLLDKIGLDKKDAEGYRLMKNGKRASFVM